jgi:hypothetical protein
VVGLLVKDRYSTVTGTDSAGSGTVASTRVNVVVQ